MVNFYKYFTSSPFLSHLFTSKINCLGASKWPPIRSGISFPPLPSLSLAYLLLEQILNIERSNVKNNSTQCLCYLRVSNKTNCLIFKKTWHFIKKKNPWIILCYHVQWFFFFFIKIKLVIWILLFSKKKKSYILALQKL